jgi:NADH-quinone oxidoreductase subunit E
LRTRGHDEPDISHVAEIVDRYDGQKRKLISILQDLQRVYGYLPRNALKLVAEKLDLHEIDVFSVATFYKGFSLEPKGEHVITLCMGTACHVRGAPSIVEDIERLLHIKAGDTTGDRKFTLETVNCLGACAIGPIVVIDGEYHGQMNIMKTRELLARYGVRVSEEALVQV